MKNRARQPAQSIGVRILCIAMALLSGCSTGRPKYAWRDLTAPSTSSQKMQPRQEAWGAKVDSADLVNPELAPGFLLTMKSIADPKLNGDYRVDFRGNLELPYDVSTNTTGLTLSDVKKRLSELYRPYFKTPSEIELQVKERKYWLDVRGLVEKPGRYLVEPEASLDAVIGASGGANKDPAPSYVRIQRGEKTMIIDLNQYYTRMADQPQILGWLGGEILFFQRTGLTSTDRASSPGYRPPVYMMGEVRKPGEYTLNPGSDFLDSLVLAGGFTETADIDSIEIIRRVGGRKRVYEFSWDELQHAPTPVQGDVVFVHADTQTRSDRKTYLFTAIASALASVVTASVLVLAYQDDQL